MKRRSLHQIQTSESDEDSEPGRAQNSKELKITPRSSDRLKTRANRQFRLPSRDEVLSRIIPKDSKETPSKSLEELRPRKLVNNFLKVNNRYNYDPDFTDSDTSLGGFLDDGDEKEEEENSTSDEGDDEEGSRSQTSQSSSSKEEERHKHRQRSKGNQKLCDHRKPLFAGEKDSDADGDDDDEDVCTTTKKIRRRQSSVLEDSSSNEDQTEEGRRKSHRAESMKRKKREKNFFEEYRAKRALRKAKV